ncbi:pre-mrna-splicing factor cwc15 [Venturia nashicola]|uniref:Pre-mrna-splicing factor cwc15 n=1 Tax=Venturia nashicola TaxID=86259 RepID=A0A4Z1P317_9PEZI|nr:pre-mrna-splicing factor cwc15 [Venturia nashicola]TLD21022.1 pre-mrna-splicing factor cwc15 [Venturia nashicola]
MTTAHRPTFDPARGKEAQRGPAFHQRLLPAHTSLKYRKEGQGGDAENEVRDLRAELLRAEAAHFAKKNGNEDASSAAPKRTIEDATADTDDVDNEDPEAKRRRLILEEARDLDADSDGSSDESSDEESDDEEDETAELMRELEKIKRERAEQRAKEEAEKAAEEQEQREFDIARGNPLLNPKDFNMRRRWDDDVVFKNQARGTEDKKSKEFVNDLLRSDFHKRFMHRSNMSGAGFGNKTATQPTHDDHDESYRFGKHGDGGAYSNAHEKYGSGATGGAGFGNKSNPDIDVENYNNQDVRFGTQSSTAPYSGGHPDYGSGSTGGAGFGNKTGQMDRGDSAVGKVMEKVGGLVKNKGLVEKGHAKRGEAGLAKDETF